MLPDGGSVVTMVSPDEDEVTVVIETVGAKKEQVRVMVKARVRVGVKVRGFSGLGLERW